jgi:hypothetical protein
MALTLALITVALIHWFVFWVTREYPLPTLEELAPEVEASPFLLHADNDNFGD